MFIPQEFYFIGKLFHSLGSPGGTLILNQNVNIIFLFKYF